LNPRPLGYEPYDDRLRCLGESLIIALTSADLRREVDSVLPCLPRLKLSRCVRFTNRFTEPVPGLRIPVVPAGTTSAWHCDALVLVTAVGPSSGQETALGLALNTPSPRTRLLPNLTADGFCPGSA
jgi:hypothetical protein